MYFICAVGILKPPSPDICVEPAVAPLLLTRAEICKEFTKHVQKHQQMPRSYFFLK